MSALKWGDVTTETPIDHLTAAPANSDAAPNSNGAATAPSSASPTTAPASLTTTSTSTPLPAPTAALPSLPPAVPVGPTSAADSDSPADALSSLSSSLSSSTVSAPAGVEESKDEEDPLPLRWQGLNPGDSAAEVEVKNAGDSIYRAVASFEQLGLSPQLLAGVYELKFTSPSKIQAQALPVILSGKQHNKPGPNLIGQAHHGSGKVRNIHTATQRTASTRHHAPSTAASAHDIAGVCCVVLCCALSCCRLCRRRRSHSAFSHSLTPTSLSLRLW